MAPDAGMVKRYQASPKEEVEVQPAVPQSPLVGVGARPELVGDKAVVREMLLAEQVTPKGVAEQGSSCASANMGDSKRAKMKISECGV
jgi:hypothetical protein